MEKESHLRTDNNKVAIREEGDHLEVGNIIVHTEVEEEAILIIHTIIDTVQTHFKENPNSLIIKDGIKI